MSRFTVKGLMKGVHGLRLREARECSVQIKMHPDFEFALIPTSGYPTGGNETTVWAPFSDLNLHMDSGIFMVCVAGSDGKNTGLRHDGAHTTRLSPKPLSRYQRRGDVFGAHSR